MFDSFSISRRRFFVLDSPFIGYVLSCFCCAAENPVAIIVYCPIHKYCWAIRTTDKSAAVADKIKTVLSSVESVFVIRSGMEAAWVNSYGLKNDAWLKENL